MLDVEKDITHSERLDTEPEATSKIENEPSPESMEVALAMSKRVNEGKNAYILALSGQSARESMGDNYNDIFDEDHRDSGQDTAIKLLKVYKSGSAQREIDNQLRVANLINSSELSNLVGVPEILNKDRHSAHLSDPDTVKHQVHISELSEDVEFIIMDLIDGVDLATLAYRHALVDIINSSLEEGFSDVKKEAIYSMLRHRMDYRPIKSNMEADYNLIEDDQERIRIMKLVSPMLSGLRGTNYDFLSVFNALSEDDQVLIDDACNIVGELDLLKSLADNGEVDLSSYILKMQEASLLEKVIVDFSEDEISKIAGQDPSLMSDDSRKKTRAFQSMIIQKISGKKIVKPELLDGLKQGLALLHENGIYHTDLHERNIMIGEGGDKIFIIDFDSVDKNDDKSLVKDDSIVSPNGLLAAMV